MMNTKILLDEDKIPKQWYNIVPDLPKALLHDKAYYKGTSFARATRHARYSTPVKFW